MILVQMMMLASTLLPTTVADLETLPLPLKMLNNFDTGIYQGAADEIDFAAAGNDILELSVANAGQAGQITTVEVPNTLIVDTPEVVLPIGVGNNNTGPAAELMFMGTDNQNPRTSVLLLFRLRLTTLV